MQFEPHYFVYDGAGWNCTQQTAGGQWVCASICSNQGRYCMLPFGYLYGLDGLDIIRENLRQICIWQQAKATYATDFGEQWWDYVARFKQNCAGSQFKNDTCSEIQQMAAGASRVCVFEVHLDPTWSPGALVAPSVRVAGLDPAATVNCMASSGGLSNDGDNTLLAHGLRERTTLDVMMLPTFIVNGVVERGAHASRTPAVGLRGCHRPMRRVQVASRRTRCCTPCAPATWAGRPRVSARASTRSPRCVLRRR